jgi:CBS domain containing-hemolysin-like protein
MMEFLQYLADSLAFDPALLREPHMLFRLGLQVLLLMGSAFFSSSETALFSLSRLDLQDMRRARHPVFGTLQQLLEEPRRLIISILCGNEIINVAATANMTAILVHIYGDAEAGLLNILIMVPLLLLFGEVTPKTIAVSDPVWVSSRIVARPMNLWVKFITPFRWVIRQVADQATTRIVGEETAPANILQVDEFRTLVNDVFKGGQLSENERGLIFNLLDAGTTEVIEIMTPRTRISYIDSELPIAEIISKVQQYRHHRLPVFRETRDKLIGFLHAEDILELVMNDMDLAGVELHEILRPVMVVPPTKKVDEMFDFFLDHKAQAAMVLSEFGGIEGIITMQDVLAFVFGPLTRKESLLYGGRPDQDLFDISGEMKLTAFNDLTNFGIEDPRMTTIGGVILRHLDRLPEVNDEIMLEGIVLRVISMDGHRVARVVASRGITEQYTDYIEELS